MKTPFLLLAAMLAVSVSAAHAVEAPYTPFGLDLSARDRSVRPGDDFWQYANGAWASRTPFPADKEAVGVAGGLSERAAADVAIIVDNLGTHPSTDPAGKKISDLYAAWVDTDAIELRGTAPLRPYLARIDAIRNRDDLARVFATPGFASPVVVGSMVDFRDPTRYIAYVGQGELGMPRDDYLLPGAKYEACRSAYRAYVLRILGLMDRTGAAARTDAILALETRMAGVLWPAKDLRDPAATARFETLAGLTVAAPSVHWSTYAASAGLKVTSLALTQGSAVQALSRIVADTPLATWKDYLAFRFVNDHADALPRAFREASFAFHATTLYGQRTMPERKASAVSLVSRAMGDAVGQFYLAGHFPAAARQQARELVEDIRAAYGDLIRASTWMDEPTRAAALTKLDHLKANIGGSDTPVDYAALRVDRDDPLGNLLRVAAFDSARDLARVDHAVDRSAWVTTPQVTNGFYDPATNQVYLTAALLQPPLLDPDADPAVNYGAMGAFIGHEIGHAFDDQGARYGPEGELRDWWSAQARQRFGERGAAISAQYATDEVLPGLRVNGAQTLGENMADISGVEAAFLAYQTYQTRHGKAPVREGLTGEQRFFLSNAQLRRSKVRNETLRQLVLFDTHAPSTIRVNRVLRNVDGWYEAFGIKRNDRLFLAPADRVRVW